MGKDITDFDCWDFNDEDLNFKPDCTISCGEEVRYANIVDCAKEIGDEMAKSGEYDRDIVVTYLEKVIAIRRYVPTDYDEETYEKFLDVVDPYRPTYDGYKKNPIILKCGYYTDWIERI